MLNIKKLIRSAHEVVDHVEGCEYGKRMSSVPLNECMCDCYEEQLLHLGYNEGLKAVAKANESKVPEPPTLEEELPGITITFEDDKSKDIFSTWFRDGGGEQEFLDILEDKLEDSGYYVEMLATTHIHINKE